MRDSSQKLSLREMLGYSCGDAAANFVFMTMVLFQSNFYTDVFGLAAGTAGTIILVARLWDAFFDPLMGILADRTHTRWGRFRPWVLFTALPWAIAMYLAYSTPAGWTPSQLIWYALITNIMLMTLYSMNNMPYSALGGVMTADIHERDSLNSFRFIAANVAQFIVGGFTLPLVAKFAGASHDRQHGWQMTMGLWGVLCFILFIITFATSRERVHPEPRQHTSPIADLADLLKNSPWIVLFLMTFIHFTLLSLQGSAAYNYFHSYADKQAMFDWLKSNGLTAAPLAADAKAPAGILEWLGYIVHADRGGNLENSNVADVFNSIMNMINKVVTISIILLSPALAKRFGKKSIAVAGFALSAVTNAAFYMIGPSGVGGMIFFTVLNAAVYAPTIPLIWAMFADVADYSEWTNGRRATGVIFATIGFAIKAGLSVGSASLLWLLGLYGYAPNQPQTARVLEGIHASTTVYIACLFALCTVLLATYKINKAMTLQIADDLAERRRKFSAA